MTVHANRQVTCYRNGKQEATANIEIPRITGVYHGTRTGRFGFATFNAAATFRPLGCGTLSHIDPPTPPCKVIDHQSSSSSDTDDDDDNDDDDDDDDDENAEKALGDDDGDDDDDDSKGCDSNDDDNNAQSALGVVYMQERNSALSTAEQISQKTATRALATLGFISICVFGYSRFFAPKEYISINKEIPEEEEI